MCANGRCTFESHGAHLAGGYELTSGKLKVDGKQFPWLIAEYGPRVESVGADEHFHILWVPVLVESPMLPEVIEAPGQMLHGHMNLVVKDGEHVEKGQVLGYVGGTGPIAEKRTGRPEPILTGEQWDALQNTHR